MILLATACVFMLTCSQITSLQSKLSDEALKNISDDKLVVPPNTYVRMYGLRAKDQGSFRRLLHHYHRPKERQINLKVLDMMRQHIYATQDRIRRLRPILAKYKNNPAFRMSYVMNRLNQLIIDARRIYTQALRTRKNRKTVYNNIVFYSYLIRKYMDILYIVEHVMEYHTLNMKVVKGI